MEEIERLHDNKIKHKKRANWVESLGFKREIVQFLTCLRNIKFDFRCFGSFPATGLTSDEDDDEENYEKRQVGIDGCDGNGGSKTIFSKWFMVLQEGQNGNFTREQSINRGKSHKEEQVAAEIRPPPNALLLMRCRSAPAKRWVEERENAKVKEREEEEEELVMEEEKRITKRSLAMVMRSDTNFHKFSCDIAKETWVLGGVRELLSRSQSWKR